MMTASRTGYVAAGVRFGAVVSFGAHHIVATLERMS